MKITSPAAQSLRVAYKAFTRVMNANTGDVSYTGIGFKPKAIILQSIIDYENIISTGFATAATKQTCQYHDLDGNWWGYDLLIAVLIDAACQGQYGTFKSFDDDGFTITWAKDTGIAGTANCFALCIG